MEAPTPTSAPVAAVAQEAAAPPRPSFWRGFASSMNAWPLGRKLATAAVLIITLALFAYLFIVAKGADQQLLYANLQPESAASVVEWLKGQNIPYSLKNAGKDIWISADKIYETRLELAAGNLPTGAGVGYEVFDKQSFTLTDYVQKVNYNRALQGELARTIASLEPVESARVHLALPEKRLFRDERRPATASVIVTLKPGKGLDKRQVRGIANLVAGSIPELEPNNVKIIDSKGVELVADDEETSDKSLTLDMLKLQQEVEGRLEMRAQDMLDRTMGADKAMVRVSATLDFSRSEKTQETFDADDPVIRSEQVTNETTAPPTLVGGVPGVQSNLESQGGVAASGQNETSNKTSRVTNYEISKTVSKTALPIGSISKLSVSVLVADKLAANEEGQAPTSVTRSPAELKEIENMVRAAVGFSPGRGDQINVSSMPFVAATSEDEHEAAGSSGPSLTSSYYQYLPLLKMLALPLAALLLYVLFVRPLVKTMRGEVKHYRTVSELEEEQMRRVETRRLDAPPAPPDPDSEVSRIREEVLRDQTPAAHIVKNWIQEG
ncbi:MAG: flagellar M-ring protein FliF [Desulfobulbaceae bacterium]|jgi:flagellar M-ring protein FliF|nr:flagellar M-ring protein FliF [Desulfobulbaceae bacterium]